VSDDGVRGFFNKDDQVRVNYNGRMVQPGYRNHTLRTLSPLFLNT
jgi:hypothetical protein